MPEGTVEVELIAGHGLKDVEFFGKSDPYAILAIGDKNHRTRTVPDGGRDPVWKQSFLFEIPDGPHELNVAIYDQEKHGADELMGTVTVHLSKLFVDRQLPVSKYKVQKPNGKFEGELEVRLKFFPKVHHGTLELNLLEAHGLLDADIFGKSDPYVVINCQQQIQKSRVINGSNDPVWNQQFIFNINSEVTDVLVKLFDKDDITADDQLGTVLVPLHKVFSEGFIPPTRYKVLGPNEQPQGEISMALKFTPKM